MLNSIFTIFPRKERHFTIKGNPKESMERLNRRTEKSDSFISNFSGNTFKGIIKDNTFKLIGGENPKGAFCVMTGEINGDKGIVKVELNSAFKILFSIFFVFIFASVVIMAFTSKDKFSFAFFPIFFLQIIMIRYLFIGLFFYRTSNHLLNRLADVLDLEWD